MQCSRRTGKQDGLREPTKRISPEDVKHMRNRVREFQVTEPMPDGSLVDVVSCASCMCRWIVEGCSAVDGAAVIQPMLQEPMAVSADIADIG